MRNFLTSAMALTAVLVVPSIASADPVSDRTQAIQLCREAVVAQSGASADAVRLDQVQLRRQVVKVDFDLWRDGQLQNIRCEVSRGQELTIASITPALQTASATAR